MTRIVHTVLLDLDTERDDGVAEILAGLRSLRALPGVLSLAVGPDVSPERLTDGFTHALVVVFASAEDRDAYLVAPEHRAVVELMRPPVLRRVVVVDVEDL